MKAIALIETGQKIIEWEICSPPPSGTAAAYKPGKKVLQWTRDISDLVLLIYGCAETGSFNNGHIHIKEIGSAIGEMFGVEIKDCANLFRQLRKRKIKERTEFIDQMKERVLQRMDDADNGIYTYRRGKR